MSPSLRRIDCVIILLIEYIHPKGRNRRSSCFPSQQHHQSFSVPVLYASNFILWMRVCCPGYHFETTIHNHIHSEESGGCG
mmetsp:Transcript_32021/g.32432  ORF Transcript_32021/g.32432 Transcript_32021/m.32432 type:complete len:81 (-) Transcript_32021:42-284(-)